MAQTAEIQERLSLVCVPGKVMSFTIEEKQTPWWEGFVTNQGLAWWSIFPRQMKTVSDF